MIEARDRFGNLRDAAEEKWVVRVRAPDVRAVATVAAAARASETVKFERRGRRCAVTLTVARAGEFEVTVAAAARGGRGERPLAEGLGWTLLVLPSASDSSVFRVDDGGGGVAGVASEVRIVPRGFEGAKGASQLVDGARKLLDQLSVEIHAPGDPPPRRADAGAGAVAAAVAVGDDHERGAAAGDDVDGRAGRRRRRRTRPRPPRQPPTRPPRRTGGSSAS